MQIFLSHSSKDKGGYVKSVAHKLGARAIYDEYTFENGMKTFDEIIRHMSNSDLFVIFLSDSALNSQWVKTELSHVRENLKITIYPIIIDHDINHNDVRIPNWLKMYTLRTITRSQKMVDLIKNRMREIRWEKNPNYRKKDLVYKGRHDESKLFEERFDDFDLPIPRVIIAQGLEKIGRKTYLTNIIKRAMSKYSDSYQPPKISLDSTQSIEDLILLLDDLGYTEEISRSDIIFMDKKEKYELASKLICELNYMKDLLIIEDNGSILKHNGRLTEWFIGILEILKTKNDDIYLLIASKFSLYNKKDDNFTDYIFHINIPELSPSERIGLLRAYIDIYSIEEDIDRSKIKNINKILSGFPSQVQYLANRIKESSFKEVIDNSNEIIEYNNEQVYKIVREYEKDKRMFDFLLLLSNIDLISFSIIDSIIEESNRDYYYNLIQKFFIEGLCIRYGADKEYFRVNDVIRDYIKRLKYGVPKTFRNSLESSLKSYLINNQYAESNITEYFYFLQQALLNGKDIDEKYLLPSHFLRTIAQLYNYQKYKDVIKISKRILKNEDFMDDSLVYEIRHYYCSSLARRRDKSFFDEVKKIEDKGEEFFLKGFYFRLEGKYQKALEMLDIAMKNKKNFSRARREKVQIFLNVYEYKTALPFAEKNYLRWKDNLFHIHAYFIILLQEEKNDENKEKLSVLLRKLNEMQNMSDKAEEMFLECQALYTSYYLNNKMKSLEIIEGLITSFPKTVYPLLAKFDILEHHNDIEGMKKMIRDIKTKDKNNNPIIHTSVIVREIAFLVHSNQKDEALKRYKTLIDSTDYEFKDIKEKYHL